jgi:hypothetical protein
MSEALQKGCSLVTVPEVSIPNSLFRHEVAVELNPSHVAFEGNTTPS